MLFKILMKADLWQRSASSEGKKNRKDKANKNVMHSLPRDTYFLLVPGSLLVHDHEEGYRIQGRLHITRKVGISFCIPCYADALQMNCVLSFLETDFLRSAWVYLIIL